MVITIDGPAGVGKTTLAKELARIFHISYLDSGALYRAITWKVLKEGIKEEKKVKEILPAIRINFQPTEEKMRVWVDGEEVTSSIRLPQVTNQVWWVCRIKEVRDKVNFLLKEYAKERDVIVEGRDMGSVVFPNAEVKIFLDASLEERALRRWREWKEKGVEKNMEEVKREIQRRDKRDRERDIAPLRIPENSFYLDTTGLSLKEVVEKVKVLVERR